VTPRELCDKYAAVHADIYSWFDIGFDIFGRSSTQQQEDIVQSIFRRLYQNGFTVQRTSKQPYCEKHKAFLADRFIEAHVQNAATRMLEVTSVTSAQRRLRAARFDQTTLQGGS